MDPVFNERKMRAWLSPLSHRARVAFGLSCCERGLPSLVAYRDETGQGSPEDLARILDAAWGFVEGRELGGDVDELIARCKRAAPTEPGATSIHAGPAVNAGFAFVLMLETIATGAIDKVIEAGAVTSDSAESYSRGDLGLDDDAPDLEAHLAAHPLVQRELRRQRDDIKLLRRSSLSRDSEIDSLRNGWASRSIFEPPRSTGR